MNHPRAVLLTDVVDSTQLSLRVGDAAMAKLWAAHDRAARDLLPVWHGREIDKTDGMLLLFDTASDAVGYALAYQHALSQLPLPLKARAGLHVGFVTLRENSPSDVSRGAKPIEVEGVAKATAARVMSTAMGGQILLSADARQSLSAGKLPLQSHGHWRLKGLDEPIELFEIGDEGAPLFPPPDSDKAYRVVRQDDLWLPVREIRHSLPAEGDTFIGRTEALIDLSRRIQSGARLVSVLGVGGTGKTRVAMRYGRSWLGEFPGGVWFCDLAPARSIDEIAIAVAQGLDIPLGSDDPVAQIGNAIVGRGSCLLILGQFRASGALCRANSGPVAGSRGSGAVRGHDTRGVGSRRRTGSGTAAASAGGRRRAVHSARPGGEAGLPTERRGAGSHCPVGRTARWPATGDRVGRGAGASDAAARASFANERAI
jgi:class 3 adenylate cyclase